MFILRKNHDIISCREERNNVFVRKKITDKNYYSRNSWMLYWKLENEGKLLIKCPSKLS